MAQSVDTGTDKLIAEIEGAVGRIVIDNPERHNAITADMFAALAAVVDGYEADPAIRVVIITGADGRAFDCWASEDFAEGRSALSEHCEPRFLGR